jgi:hypothetical protein
MEEELTIEPEECETCRIEMEQDGIEYTLDYYVEDGYPHREHCGMPL